MHPAPLIELESVSKSFREGEQTRHVLESVDLQVPTGTRLALIGQSGSGKSTLLNLLGGIEAPDTGRIRVGGVELTAATERERTLFRRHHVGFVYQFFNLLPTLTAEENVALPLELAGTRPAIARQRAREMLDGVGLSDRARSYPDRLSGGERQRVAIARALIHEPDLVLADEPTGNLDARSGQQVLELLESLGNAHDTTLVLVTHSRAVAQMADRILTLDTGRLMTGDEALAW